MPRKRQRSESSSKQSVNIGGNARNVVAQQGNSNTASITDQRVVLPDAKSVDMAKELQSLRTILAGLKAPDQAKVNRALDDAQEEIKKPKANKDEVGGSLDRALKYASTAAGFAAAISRLKPHIEKAAAWLGTNWYSIMRHVNINR